VSTVSWNGALLLLVGFIVGAVSQVISKGSIHAGKLPLSPDNNGWQVQSVSPSGEVQISHDQHPGVGISSPTSTDLKKSSGDIFDRIAPSVTLPNGANIRKPRGPRGLGVLTISNFTAADAAVAVVGTPLQYGGARTMRYVYVKAASELKLVGIPAGSYSVLFRQGTDWDRSLEMFRSNETLARFGDPLIFTESHAWGNRTEYSAYALTLHEVPNGNIKKQPISSAEFINEVGPGKSNSGEPQ
jgi:hypothetical protein